MGLGTDSIAHYSKASYPNWKKNEEKMNVTFTMNFGDALVALKAGQKVTRSGWNGKGMWLGLQKPDLETGKMTLPYIYMKTADNHLVPWLASQTDILASDWMILTL